MALRYKFRGVVPEPKPFGELKKPRAMRAPVKVEFRRGADLKVLAESLKDVQCVALDAAVGAGKSTVFPSALAEATGELVFHVMPNSLLSLDLHQYVLSKHGGAFPLVRWTGKGRIPAAGLVHMSSSDLVLLAAEEGGLSRFPDLNVILDEYHESDCCTFLLRHLGLNLGMKRLIMSSATSGPSGFRERETPGNVVYRTFPASEVPKTWRIDDAKKPWAYATLKDNLVIFVDSRSDARYLHQAYDDVGLVVHRVVANMDEDAFLRAMKDMRDEKGPLVVFLADYSFRSAATFTLGRTLDTGSVSYHDPTPGAVRILHRPMVQLEKMQGSSRGAREKAGTVEYFCPDAEFPAEICDIEGVEREAAALLCRVLGFKPVGVLAATIMSSQDLPDGIAVNSALASVYPLTYRLVSEDGKFRVQRQSEEGREDSGVEAGSSGVEDAAELSDASETGSAEPPKYTDDVDYLAFVNSLDVKVDVPELGSYLRVPEVSAVEKATSVFPSGLRSVRAFVDGDDGQFNVKGLSEPDRKCAVSLVVNRYNMLNIELDAMTEALKELAMRGRPLSMELRAVTVGVFEDRGRLQSERAHLHGLLRVLTSGYYEVVSMAQMRSLVAIRLASYAELLRPPADEVVDDDVYAEQLSRLSVSEGIGSRTIDYSHEQLRGHRRRSRHWSEYTCTHKMRLELPPALPFMRGKRITVVRPVSRSERDKIRRHGSSGSVFTVESV